MVSWLRQRGVTHMFMRLLLTWAKLFFFIINVYFLYNWISRFDNSWIETMIGKKQRRNQRNICFTEGTFISFLSLTSWKSFETKKWDIIMKITLTGRDPAALKWSFWLRLPIVKQYSDRDSRLAIATYTYHYKKKKFKYI